MWAKFADFNVNPHKNATSKVVNQENSRISVVALPKVSGKTNSVAHN